MNQKSFIHVNKAFWTAYNGGKVDTEASNSHVLELSKVVSIHLLIACTLSVVESETYMLSKRSLKEYTTDELLDVVSRLPVGIFGYREFDIYSKATSATVNDNYPESMTVITLETDERDGETADLLYNDDADYNFKEPIFIG